MRVDEGLDSGPVALAGGARDRRPTTTARSRRRWRARAASCSSGRSTCAPPAALELAEQDDSRATYAEKIDPGERRLDPARPAAELERVVRALTPHIGAYLELAGGERLGVTRRRGRGRRRAAAGTVEADGTRCGSAAARGRCGCCGCAPPAGGRWTPRTTCAATRRRAWREPRRRAGGAEITPARRAAYEVLRRTFEDGAWTDRAFTATAARLDLDGRELARARRLAYGSVQRRGTSDHLIAVARPAPASHRRGRRSRRCGSGSSSCSSPTTPTSTPRSTRRSSWRRPAPARDRAPAARRAGRLGVRQRAAAPGRERARASCSPRSTTRLPTARRSPTPIRRGWRGCGGRSSARARRGC